MRIYLYAAIILLLAISGCNDDIFSPITDSQTVIKDDSTSVTLKYDQSILINNELTIGFNGVPTDSRCPINAMCVWAGDGEVKLSLKKGSEIRIVSLHTTLDPKIIIYDNYEIQLIQLLPSRMAGVSVKQEDYSVGLKIKYKSPFKVKSVYLIDGQSESLITKDPLVINDAVINQNILTLSFGYSGGCKEHIINLFAYTGIMKSNPPQMSLVISHQSNKDNCEAYYTGKIQFDLTSLKNYLAGYEKVLLNISNVDGVPIKQSPLLLNLK